MFWDLGGAAPVWAELREIHIDSGNVFAVLDSWEVVAIASGLCKINWVGMIRLRFRSNKEFVATNLVN